MKLLVAHDGSAQADKALAEATRLAEKLGGTIAVVAVVPDLCLTEISDQECKIISESLFTEMRSSMNKVTAELREKGIVAEILIKEGHPAERIIETAEAIGSELVVVGSRGRHGGKKLLLGSVSASVVGQAKCNVLVVK